MANVISRSDESERRLFVTLSNLSFLPAILIALNWQHFHLAIIYLFAMICSMLYHWCDSSPLWPSSDDCVLPYDTLQFADFFAAGVSAWGTLLAMAVIGHRLKLICLTAAFITFAITVHSSRFHIATFATPLAIASIIVLSSWIYRCRRFHVIYPPNEGLIRLSIGICLTAISALLYLYFQEGVSYEYVHSAWHIIVQLSACCLLPKPITADQNNGAATTSNGSPSTSSGLISSEAQLLALTKRRTWLAVNFPLFDTTFWHRVATRSFWRAQIDDCCGVIDHGPQLPLNTLSRSGRRDSSLPHLAIRPPSSISNNSENNPGADQTSFTPAIVSS